MAINSSISAPKLKIILIIVLILLTAGCVGGFVYGQSKLSDYAMEVSKKKIDADASQTRITSMNKVQAQLNQNKTAIERAGQISAKSQSYQYQDQVITDIKELASRSGVSIANIDFTPPAGAATTKPSAAASSPVTGTTKSGTAATSSDHTPATGASSAPSLKSTTVTITLQNPLDFNSYLKFLHYIEQSLTKMQISKVELNKVQDKNNSAAVNASALAIEVYLK